MFKILQHSDVFCINTELSHFKGQELHVAFLLCIASGHTFKVTGLLLWLQNDGWARGCTLWLFVSQLNE